MAEPKRPKGLVFNEALLKNFINGDLEPVIEAKVAKYLESRPELLERIASKSDGDFLERLKSIHLRRSVEPQSEIEPPAAFEAEIVHPVIVDKHSAANNLSIPRSLAEYSGYRVTKELGRGGMGVVYLAKNVQMDRLEVLKVLNKRLIDHEEAKERFLREIRAVSKLSHPNIVTSYSILPLENLVAFAMEYVHGIDLHKYTHKYRPMAVGLACSFAKQIAAGLQHAHEKGFVHRDIKPSNVIVYKSDGQLQLKILDFGLAKATSEKAAESAGLTQDGTMLGTPEYMSPEQTLNAAKADVRADIYSLGCTLYFMLTGKPPFTGTHGEVLMAHAQREPKLLNLIRPEVPAELTAVVGKMLAKDVRKRYQTPSEVADALSPFVNQLRSAASQSPEVEAVSNTVNDLNGADRETSVEASLSELSLEADNHAVAQDLANLTGSLKAIRTVTQSQTNVRRAKAKPRFRKWFLPTAATLGAMILLIGFGQLASVTFKTPNGTIIVENMPADAELVVDGQKVEIVWNGGKDKAEVSIDAGTHQLRVLNQGNEIFGDRVSVKGGGTFVLRLQPSIPSTNSKLDVPEAEPKVEEVATKVRETTPNDSETIPKVLNSMPLGTALATLPEQRAQSTLPQGDELQAKPCMLFHFNGDAKDAITGRATFQLKNTKFMDNSLCLNGIYAPMKNGYTAICRNAQINFESFTVAMRFLAQGLVKSNKPMVYRNNLITGGHYNRWFSLERSPAEGNVIVSLENAKFSQEIKGVGLEYEKWTVIACSVDVPGRMIIVAVNGRVVSTIDLPANFRIGKVAQDEKLWTFTNYSNGNVFQGLVDELITYDHALNAEEITRIPLVP